MFGTRWSVVAVLGFALAACSHSRTGTRAGSADQSAAARQPAAEHGMETRCPGPMALEGTKVAAEDTASGEAITFTTTGDVDELRRRVHAMADMHNAHHGGEAAAGGQSAGEPGSGGGEQAGDAADQGSAEADPHGGMMGGMHGGMGNGGMHGGMGGGMQEGMGGMHGAMNLPDSTASVEDVEGGARVYVTPKDPADLEDLQSGVRSHVERMQAAGCGMKSRTGMNEKGSGEEPRIGERF